MKNEKKIIRMMDELEALRVVDMQEDKIRLSKKFISSFEQCSRKVVQDKSLVRGKNGYEVWQIIVLLSLINCSPMGLSEKKALEYGQFIEIISPPPASIKEYKFPG